MGKTRHIVARFAKTGNTKIGEVGVAFGINHDIARLNIAVDDPLPMGIIERTGDLAHHIRDFGQWERPPIEDIFQCATLQKPHDDIGWIMQTIIVVYRDDIRVF